MGGIAPQQLCPPGGWHSRRDPARMADQCRQTLIASG
jgi:hypothetical protein